ncbi:hypothetical protein JCM8097_007400 [Rhodosporidiobolus ruineniae]
MLRTLPRFTQLAQHLTRSSSTMSDAALAKGPKTLQKEGLVFLLAQTPNGGKVAYLAEELKAIGALKDYHVVPVSFKENEQKSEWFEAVNPNGRIPALLHNREDGKKIKVWESASILEYLIDVYDKDHVFSFADLERKTEVRNWVYFLQGGVGPMQGQANHFYKYAPEKIPYGIKRYQDETARLYGVYEQHLSGAKDGVKKDWLVGGKYTIADMVAQPWVRMHGWCGVDIAPFPHLAAWVERIEQRPATQAALKVPEQDMLTKMKTDPELEAKMAKESSDWIMKGQKK